MFVIQILKQAITVSLFVMIMMTVLEYFAVHTRGKVIHKFKNRPFAQILLATLLGLLPGCLGTYAVVSMYIHGSLTFGALIANLIATFGDEAFIMISLIPFETLILAGILFVIAILSGIAVNFFSKKKSTHDAQKEHIVIHTEEISKEKFTFSSVLQQLRHITWQRAVIIGALSVFTMITVIGEAHGHPEMHAHEAEAEHPEHEHENLPAQDPHNNEMSHLLQLIFVVASIGGLFIALASPDHFLSEHIWGHIIKKHFLRIFLWTFGAFFVLHLLNEYLDVTTWISENQRFHYVLLLIAVLVGLIPESGPHIIFLTLYTTGMAPFSILLASSIVQDGHGAIPLLAETRRGFIRAKAINAFIALLVGSVALSFGF